MNLRCLANVTFEHPFNHQLFFGVLAPFCDLAFIFSVSVFIRGSNICVHLCSSVVSTHPQNAWPTLKWTRQLGCPEGGSIGKPRSSRKGPIRVW
jgi:hypothetical protein